MRQLLVRSAIIGLVGLAPVAVLNAAERNADTTAAGAVALEDIEARCVAMTQNIGDRVDVQHCITRLRSEWQQAQLNAVRSQPVAKPQAPELDANWRSLSSDTLRPNVKGLRLSLDDD